MASSIGSTPPEQPGWKEQLSAFADKVCAPLEKNPVISGLALVAISCVIIAVMAHAIDSDIGLNIMLGAGITAALIGFGPLLLKKIKGIPDENDPNRAKTKLEKVCDILKIIGPILILGAGLLIFMNVFGESFFDGASVSNIIVFGAAITAGAVGISLLINRNKYQKLKAGEKPAENPTSPWISLIGTIAYTASVAMLMHTFAAKGDIYSTMITSILLAPAGDMLGLALNQFALQKEEKRKIAVQQARQREVELAATNRVTRDPVGTAS